MQTRLIDDPLRGHFLGVGSVSGPDHETPFRYVTSLKVPYCYQLPSLREEDMIRQFAYLVEGFERDGDYILDLDMATYQEIVLDSDALLPDEQHAHSLYRMARGERKSVCKTQQTAPATMCFSIRSPSGKTMVSADMFRLFTSLMTRVARGQAELLEQNSESVILCQDDPALGFVQEIILKGEAPGLTFDSVLDETENVYPPSVIPAYHYCSDWRALKHKSRYPLWDGRRKIVHVDLVRYLPPVDEEQSERINSFLQEGGGIALGVIPNTDEGFRNGVVPTVKQNLRIALKGFRNCGVDTSLVAENAMVSTQCGLVHASAPLVEKIHSLDESLPSILEKEASRL